MSDFAPDLLEWLTAFDFTRVLVEYRSFNGRGEFLRPRCTRPPGWDFWSIEGERADRLIALFAPLLESRYPGWREKHESFGAFRWDLDTNQVTHTHHVRVWRGRS
jgi:hypothetical protein